MGVVLDLRREFESVSCCVCGVEFWIPESMLGNLRETKNSFYCPNGHSLSYKKSILEKTREELNSEKQRHQHTLARLNSLQAEAERLKKRAAAGVCPYCNRTFQNLARHMKTKHPEVVDASKNGRKAKRSDSVQAKAGAK